MEFIHSFQDHIFTSQLDKYFIYNLKNNVWEYLLQVPAVMPYFGDVIFLSQLRAPVVLVPNFSRVANSCLSKFNCTEYASEFWLAKYFEKDFYHSQLPDE